MPTPIPTAASGCSCWPPRFPGASGCRCCSGWAGASAGGGRWRRLAQALLAVLGTGAVPVLHLRRQRPLDLRAARPAGLALLAADLLRAPLARSAWLRRGGLACLALTPLLFALFLGSLLLGSRAEQKSTAALLASDAGWRERPLVFWPKRPYSAVFYSGGRAQRAEDSEQPAGCVATPCWRSARVRSAPCPTRCASACAVGRRWDSTSYASVAPPG